MVFKKLFLIPIVGLISALIFGSTYTKAFAEGPYHYQGESASYYLDGNYMGGLRSGLMSQGNYNAGTDWLDRAEMWGFSQNVNSYLNLPNGNTGIIGLDFKATVPDQQAQVVGASPRNTASSLLPNISFLWADVPYIQGITGLINSLYIGVSETSSDLFDYEEYWSHPSNEYDLSTSTSNTDALGYRGYSQRFGLSGSSGYWYTNSGYIVYQTPYWYSSNPNLVEYSTDYSGTMVVNGQEY